ncbi:hypothetical protein [Oceanobacillus salinisoli]|uniref:hypothetical protein n=1 Tax=Oceanobacillus salinisoli TaxID=2678611 RepID=UPI0018CBF87C|nr:hypothetical protein [Oceanobacillus salinisoli]
MPVVQVCDECGAKAGTCNCYDWEIKKKAKCFYCDEEFVWDDYVVIVEDELYHKDCVELYPTGYFAMLDGEPLGETENEDGQMASEIIDDLLDEEEA